MPSGRVALSRVLALGVPIAWHEGVAVALATAERLSSVTSRAGFDTCFLTGDGGIDITADSARPFAAPPLRTLATALVAAPQAPEELVSLLARYEHVPAHDCDRLEPELRFFSRPDLDVAISALVARTLQKEAELETQHAIAQLRTGAIDGAKDHPLTPPPRRRARALAMVGAAAALTVGGAYAIGSRDLQKTTAVSYETITHAIDGLVARGFATMREPIAAQPAAVAPAPVAAAKRATRSPRTPVRALPPVDSRNEIAGPSRPVVIVPHAAEVPVAADVVEPPLPLEGVFDSRHADVNPPAFVHAQVRTADSTEVLPPATWLDLLIDEHGRVEKVRLASLDSRVPDRMLVSAAKAWRFWPATKDGAPVKYALRVGIAR